LPATTPAAAAENGAYFRNIFKITTTTTATATTATTSTAGALAAG
jgi:hypothetical protein